MKRGVLSIPRESILVSLGHFSGRWEAVALSWGWQSSLVTAPRTGCTAPLAFQHLLLRVLCLSS